MIITALNTPSHVKTKIPLSVFGGEIFSLFGERLKDVLQYSEEPRLIDLAVTGKPEFYGQTEANKAHSITPIPEQEPANELIREFYTAKQIMSHERGFSPEGALHAAIKKSKIFETEIPIPDQDSTNESRRKFNIVKQIMSDKRSFSFEDDLHAAIKRSRTFDSDASEEAISFSGQAFDALNKDQHLGYASYGISNNPHKSIKIQTSILVEKLREYWELSQREQSERYESKYKNNINFDQEKSRLPIITPIRDSAIQPWPETTAEQVNQKVQSIVSSQRSFDLPKHLEVQNCLSEKAEIQNIFNISIKTEDKGALKDLPEKIADILREQALQHGIDIT